MRYLIVIYVILFSCSFAANAQGLEKKDELVHELAINMGLYDMLDVHLEQSKSDLYASVLGAFGDLEKTFPGLNKKQEKELKEIVSKYTSRVIDSIKRDEVVAVYIDIITKDLSDEEIKRANEYYQTKEAQRFLELHKVASLKIANLIYDALKDESGALRPRLMEEIKLFKEAVLIN